MSSRIRSELGRLGDRARPRPQTRRVEVEVGGDWHPGLLVGWQRGEDGWWAEAAWVEGDALYVRLVPAAKVRPDVA